LELSQPSLVERAQEASRWCNFLLPTEKRTVENLAAAVSRAGGRYSQRVNSLAPEFYDNFPCCQAPTASEMNCP